ncbi:hypothetical protein MGG_14564 [Pyricularia oryzae 70-15]|uniref:Uncharacterized protein n=3 Tax=Pyricularia oryzae TaxID=318829 RepID=G4MNU0_PYRO7|nr:uncharacterized protein MGG_14564 [Pyricularia oryzae 70-15]EHA57097.1 hypothetical protein MGG_14564 [Pyricularia oryzae 70-15]ELQ35885.1 hypothetical protein OOU_Y34scaffold00684g25 [Pyricularia oryzae Y34]
MLPEGAESRKMYLSITTGQKSSAPSNRHYFRRFFRGLPGKHLRHGATHITAFQQKLISQELGPLNIMQINTFLLTAGFIALGSADSSSRTFTSAGTANKGFVIPENLPEGFCTATMDGTDHAKMDPDATDRAVASVRTECGTSFGHYNAIANGGGGQRIAAFYCRFSGFGSCGDHLRFRYESIARVCGKHTAGLSDWWAGSKSQFAIGYPS